MKYCTKCGKQLADEIAFCPSCGQNQNGRVDVATSQSQNLDEATKEAVINEKIKMIDFMLHGLKVLCAIAIVLQVVAYFLPLLDYDNYNCIWWITQCINDNIDFDGNIAGFFMCGILSIIFTVIYIIRIKKSAGVDLLIYSVIFIITVRVMISAADIKDYLGVGTKILSVTGIVLTVLSGLIMVINSAVEHIFPEYGSQKRPYYSSGHMLFNDAKTDNDNTWICPDCGNHNSNYVGFCKCGRSK